MATSFARPFDCLHEASIVSSNYHETETSGTMENLYDTHRDGVYHAALRVTHNPHDAEDVVQNVFLRMLRNDTRPEEGRSAAAYLNRAATNMAIDLIRKRMQQAETTIPFYQPAPRQPFGEEHLVEQVMEKLSPESARLLELHCDGYLYEELAGIFGIQMGTVKSRLHRIRAALQKELQAA